MRKSVIAAMLALALALGGTAGAAEPYVLHVILALTGPGALLGTTEQQALQRFEATLGGEKLIGGRPIHFEFHDDQSSPQTAVQLATELAAKKPAVILGSNLVAMCNAMSPLMRRGPVMYCFSPGIRPAAGGFVWSSSISTKDLAATQLRYFRAKGWTKIAVITSTDASGQDAARNIKELLAEPENKEFQVVSEQTFNPSDISAAAQVQRIKGAGPQALIAWSTGTAVGTVFKAIGDAGLEVPVATTDGNMTFATMQRFADILPKELYIPSPTWPKSDRLQEPPQVVAAKNQFFAAFDGTATKPDNAAALAWDPALIVVTALQKLGPDASAEQIRSFLAGSKDIIGIKGTYDFTHVPQRGLDDSNVVVTRWDPAMQDWIIVSKPRGEPF
jgi:branched-chain amino acid transport system substrate-binding protein